MKKILILLLIVPFILSGCLTEKNEESVIDNTPESDNPTISSETIKIAAFNIQIFGKSKREKADVMAILTRIAREFDVMLVQETRDASETTAQVYLDGINAMEGPDYAFVRSPRLTLTP